MLRANLLIRLIFIFWVLGITFLGVIPHSDDGIMVSSNVTPSGMEKHLVGYFIATLLCYYAYGKKEDGGQRTERQRSEVRGQRSDLPATLSLARRAGVRGRKDRGLRSEVTFIWISGLLIFLFSMILEIAQFYLPYRTFNVYDVVGNGVGVLLFVVGWLVFGHRHTPVRSSGPTGQTQTDTDFFPTDSVGKTVSVVIGLDGYQ